MAELFCAGGAGENNAHDEGSEAAGEPHPLEERVTRQQGHNDAEQGTEFTVAELVPAAGGQCQQRDDGDQQQRSQAWRFAPKDAHERDGQNVLHDQYADADIAVEGLLVAAVLQNLDDDDGAGEAQDQRDVYSHGEIGGAEGAKRAEGGDEARANQRHHENMSARGEPDCLIRQRAKIQA